MYKTDEKQIELNKLFVHAARKGNVVAVQECLRMGADIHYACEEALREAAFQEHKELVKYLISQNAKFHEALGYAAGFGDLTVVKRLIEYNSHSTSVATLKEAFGQLENLDTSKAMSPPYSRTPWPIWLPKSP